MLEDKVDFVKFAEAMGAVGIRVTKKEEFGRGDSGGDRIEYNSGAWTV
ncbi:MAG: hypothetical protein ACLVAT_02810 [Lachnospiraceae bacterium]